MKIQYSWLKEISGVDWSVEEMEDRLTRSGTAGVAHKINPDHFKEVVVGHITKLEKHPNADKLLVTEVANLRRDHADHGADNFPGGEELAAVVAFLAHFQ